MNKRRTGVTAGVVTRHLQRLWILMLIGALTFGFAPTAEAHTDFAGSDPADGQTISEPVAQIQVRFTAPSLVAGDGFVVLTPTGEILSPEVSVSEDGREFTLLFDPALVDGEVGVQWSVRAGDAHPIEGTFSFTTTAAAPTPIPEPIEPQDVVVDSDAREGIGEAQNTDTVPADAADAPAGSLEVEPVDLEAEGDRAQLEEPEAATDSSLSITTGSEVPAAAVTMDEFLSDESSNRLAGIVGFVGRFVSQAGALLAVGVVAFAVLVGRQTRNETSTFVRLIRIACLGLIVGGVIEAVGLVMSLASVADALFGWAGLAICLRVGGAVGLLLVLANGADAQVGSGAVSVDKRVLAGAGGTGAQSKLQVPQAVGAELSSVSLFGVFAWVPAALIVLSFIFDGHTVTKGNRLLTAVVDLVHVGGAAVWLGGLVCLVMLSRSCNEHEGLFVERVVKFSVVASVALVAVGVAGLALTVTILDSFSELWSTNWGRLLIAKVAIVGVAMAAGAFNHFVVVPQLKSPSPTGSARALVIRTIKIEVAALGLAVVITAVLVASAS